MKRGKDIYLHIGTEKTGTTTIQAFLHANRDRLGARGVLYPQTAGARNHTLLALYAARYPRVADLGRQHRVLSEELRDAWAGPFAARLREEIAAFDGHSVMLSNEHCWSRLLFTDAIGRLRELLEPVARSFRVLVYFRPQDELLWSSYSTSVKSGAIRPFAVPAGAMQRNFQYLAVLDDWSTIFGREAIHARVFDRDRLLPGVLEAEVCAFAGIDDVSGWRRVEQQNPSLDFKHMEFLRRLNKHVPHMTERGLNPLRANLVQILERDSSSSRAGVPYAELERFYQRFQASNAGLAERYFGLVGQPLFVRSAPPPISDPGRLTLDDAAAMAAVLWIGAMERTGEAARPSSAETDIRPELHG